MKQSMFRKIDLLIELNTNGYISASKVKSNGIALLISRLEQSGLIRKHKQGNGNRYTVVHKEQLNNFIIKEFPQIKSLEHSLNSGVSNRVSSISTYSDSKMIKSLGFDIVMLRGNVVINFKEHQYSLTEFADDALLSLKISANQRIQLQANPVTIITIENPTTFFEIDLTHLNCDVAVYTAGKMSNLLIEQLVEWHKQGHKLVHFGDYDYVGMLEYVRVLERCDSADIYVPETLTADFISRFGNSGLLQNQSEIHQGLINKMTFLTDSPQKTKLITLYNLIQGCSKGLEQEALLIQKLNIS